jgi:hypothetical protein
MRSGCLPPGPGWPPIWPCCPLRRARRGQDDPVPILPAGSLFLYISTATVLEDASSGYILAPQYDNLDALQESIMDAMRTPGALALNLGTVGGGVVILSGAQLPFAVIAEGRLLRAGHAGGAHVNQER